MENNAKHFSSLHSTVSVKPSNTGRDFLFKLNAKKLTAFRPTVILGLGGTGHEILLRLKKYFIDYFGEVPPNISFLSIDVTEPENETLGLSDGNVVSLDSVTERLLIQVSNPANVIENNPHIREWWPENTPVSAIISGAGQLRPLGRLAFFAKYSDIVESIKDTIERVINVYTVSDMDQSDLRGSERQGIDVYIVSSVAGGTGSGMLLDVAFNVRRLIDSASNITGIVVLPRIFERSAAIRQKPNSYAALKEIEFFMKIRNRDSYLINYGRDSFVRISKPPFDLLYIADAITERRKIITNPELLFSVLAEGLYIQIASQIGTRSDNSLNNIKTQLGILGNVRARSANYCSFGLASLALDLESFAREQETAKVLSAIHIVDEMLNGNFSKTTPADKVLNVIYEQAHPVNLAEFLSEEMTKSSSRPLSFSITDYGLSLDARRKIESDLRKRFYNQKAKMEKEVASVITANHDQMREEGDKRIRDWWENTVDRLGGLKYAALMADRIILEIEQHQRYVENQISLDQKTYEDIEKEIPRLLAEMQRVCSFFRFFLGGGKNKLGELKSNTVQRANEIFSLYVRLEGYKKTMQLLEAIKQRMEALKEECLDICAVLEKARNHIIPRPMPDLTVGKDSNPFERILQIDQDLIQSLQFTIAPEDFIKMYNSRYGSIKTLAKEQTAEIAARIQAFVEDHYAAQGDSKIENLMSRMSADRLGIFLKRLSELASPLWSYDETNLPLPHSTIFENSCYGVFDPENTFLKKNADQQLAPGRSKPGFVPLLDPHRIKLFKVRAGVPLFALDGMNDLEHAYYAQQDFDSGFYHIDKRWGSFPDLIPLASQVQGQNKRMILRRWFAIAQAALPFEIITENQNEYLLHLGQRGDGDSETISLGKDYQTAFSTFASHQSYVQAVEQKVCNIFCTHEQEIAKTSLKDRIDHILNHNQKTERGFEVAGDIESEIILLLEILAGWDSFINEICPGHKHLLE